MAKPVDKYNITHIKGFREPVYGQDNKIIGFWELGKGTILFNN